MSATVVKANNSQDVGALIGRILMSAIFIWSGFAKLTTPAEMTAYFGGLGLPLPGVVWVVTVIWEFVGGLALLIGIQTRLAALVLGIWCIATALVAHSNFAELNMQIHFMKNLAMAGGFIFVALFGAGAYSWDEVRKVRKISTS